MRLTMFVDVDFEVCYRTKDIYYTVCVKRRTGYLCFVIISYLWLQTYKRHFFSFLNLIMILLQLDQDNFFFRAIYVNKFVTTWIFLMHNPSFYIPPSRKTISMTYNLHKHSKLHQE